ncbi:ribosome small subunit-dependent GTPase A [Tepidimicrobium xylanilyticum]|uniref:Small ribosomal subunit biogenesis GTPase RsgA n=1 Tax=Tepidimicrobium xylanilyticum TaxID=1123352 RepID=A0A1H2YQN3_9FIRM|nr:ribosome small subunit-dependent GTPase A [Tepidimicrobium xylanilyticum]GMG97188.1 putative ribosome biogenesis GTPase RsgA [Tepidimicrobium xylanilyticum]SDX07477.1 ribosome biogenesis GTPase [Tepidimicrobium xylanilyticum]
MIEGIIIKGIGGFYYVKTQDKVYECKARGLFREDNIIPLIGDRVKIRINEEDGSGYIEEIMERKSQLIRPPVSNVTQAIIIMSIKKPDINLWLLDRLIVLAEHQRLNIGICINKIDLVQEDERNLIEKAYRETGYPIIKTSCKTGEGIVDLIDLLKNQVTVFAGPSGVGKSSLLNRIKPGLELKTGDVSKKTTRGRHTTRHVELIDLDGNSFVLDTPGFSSLSLDFIEREEELSKYFKEIDEFNGKCKFINCIHFKEPGCEVKKQVEKGNISRERYENYLMFLEEIKANRRY